MNGKLFALQQSFDQSKNKSSNQLSEAKSEDELVSENRLFALQKSLEQVKNKPRYSQSKSSSKYAGQFAISPAFVIKEADGGALIHHVGNITRNTAGIVTAITDIRGSSLGATRVPYGTQIQVDPMIVSDAYILANHGATTGAIRRDHVYIPQGHRDAYALRNNIPLYSMVELNGAIQNIIQVSQIDIPKCTKFIVDPPTIYTNGNGNQFIWAMYRAANGTVKFGAVQSTDIFINPDDNNWQRLLNTPHLRTAFIAFLTSQFSLENLSFLEAVDNINDTAQNDDIARQIYTNYVGPNASYQINISFDNRRLLDQKFAIPFATRRLTKLDFGMNNNPGSVIDRIAGAPLLQVGGGNLMALLGTTSTTSACLDIRGLLQSKKSDFIRSLGI